MKKILAILAFVALMVACQSPVSMPSTTAQTETHTLIVKNSLWQTVRTQTVTIARSLASDKAALQAEIDAYNALYKSDYQWVYGDNAPDLDHAPAANVFWCNPQTNIPNMYELNVSRRYLVEHWSDYQIQAQGQAFYVDHIPPVPVLAKETTPYEWYSLYLVDSDTGDTIYFDHCGYRPDESFDPAGISDYGTADRYYSWWLGTFNMMAGSPVTGPDGVVHQHSHVVTRQIYPPLPPIITDPVTPVTP